MKRPGDINRNGQQLLRATDERGTDHNARIWILKCRNCLNIYGSNSTDAFERKCPKCQSGKPGLPVPIERDGQDWTHEEHLIAFQLYSRIPFGTIHMRNPPLKQSVIHRDNPVIIPDLLCVHVAGEYGSLHVCE